MNELPLVFFTVLGQMGAGTVLMTSLYSLICKQTTSVIKIMRINTVALIIMALAMIIASFHLGHPLRALNVIFGIGRSPMSNEIFTFGILFSVTFISVLLTYFSQPDNGNRLQLLKKLTHKINHIPGMAKLLALVLIIVSLFFIWTIVATYMLTTVKNWDTPYTVLQMYSTMLILGGVTITVFGIRKLGIICFTIGSIIVLTTKLPYIHFVSGITPDLAQAQYCFWLIQCGTLGIALIITFINSFKCGKSTAIYAAVAILALVGELSGRIAFYNLWAIPM
ncbi:dimethyl sulfoxide reductase anchor subunit family protein [Orbus mooreae]|uniref:dimethyl sulfoxide reductase anchor subunit family protein n=1 Tax=Orbus mooreae TaxID=3074107 RepID=UPI00370D3BB8